MAEPQLRIWSSFSFDSWWYQEVSSIWNTRLRRAWKYQAFCPFKAPGITYLTGVPASGAGPLIVRSLLIEMKVLFDFLFCVCLSLLNSRNIIT